jgi:hypothetical protein
MVFVRQVRDHVMVRTGGGWDTLAAWLAKLAVQLSASPTKGGSSPRRRGTRDAGKGSGLRQSSASSSPSIHPPQSVGSKSRSKPELPTTPEQQSLDDGSVTTASSRSFKGDVPPMRRRSATVGNLSPKAKAKNGTPQSSIREQADSKDGKTLPPVKPRKKTALV